MMPTANVCVGFPRTLKPPVHLSCAWSRRGAVDGVGVGVTAVGVGVSNATGVTASCGAHEAGTKRGGIGFVALWYGRALRDGTGETEE